jgi:alpha-glucoside transport system permease protein
MDNIAGTKSSLTWAVHISVAALVLLWIFPTLGLFVSSFRTTDQITDVGLVGGAVPAEQNETFRTADPDETRSIWRALHGGGQPLMSWQRFVEDRVEDVPAISVWGTSSRAIDAYVPGDVADLGDGETFTVAPKAIIRWAAMTRRFRAGGSGSSSPPTSAAGIHARPTTAASCSIPATGGHGQGVLQHADGDDPGHDHPDPDRGLRGLCAGLDGFPGRALLIAAVVGAAGGAAATGADPAFVAAQRDRHRQGLSGRLAGAYRLRPAARDLSLAQLHGRPAADIIENAKVDGATDFQIFTKIILPLSLPGAGQFRDLPVPVDVERPAGGARCS